MDEQLTDDERQHAEQVLTGSWKVFKTGVDCLEERRVPMVLPVGTDYVASVQIIRANLRKTGISGDRGQQVVWLGPCDVKWTATFMMAIAEESGFHPYFFKRWFPSLHEDHLGLVRGELQVIDADRSFGS